MRGKQKTLIKKQPVRARLNDVDKHLRTWAKDVLPMREQLLKALPNLNPKDALTGERGSKDRRAYYAKLALMLATIEQDSTQIQILQSIMLSNYGLRRLLFSNNDLKGFGKKHGTLVDSVNPFQRKKLQDYWHDYRANTLASELQQLVAAKVFTRAQASYIIERASKTNTLQAWHANIGSIVFVQYNLLQTKELACRTAAIAMTLEDKSMHNLVSAKLDYISDSCPRPNENLTLGQREDLMHDLEDIQLYLGDLLSPAHNIVSNKIADGVKQHKKLIETIFDNEPTAIVYPIVAPELQFFIAPEISEDRPNLDNVAGQYQGRMQMVLLDKLRADKIASDNKKINKTLIHELIHSTQANNTPLGGPWDKFIENNLQDTASESDYVWAKLELVLAEGRTEEAALHINNHADKYDTSLVKDPTAHESYSGYRVFQKAFLKIIAEESREQYDYLITNTASLGQGEYFNYLYKELTQVLGKSKPGKQIIEARVLECVRKNTNTPYNENNVTAVIEWIFKTWRKPSTADDKQIIKEYGNTSVS